MKLHELNLYELGNSPASYVPNRKRKRSLFHATVDSHYVDVYFEPGLGGSVQIIFTVDGETKLPQLKKNKEGSASKSKIKILSTVLNIIKQQLPQYIKKVRPLRVAFTGEEPNRVNLYRKRMVPFINELLGPKWDHEESIFGDKTVFVWARGYLRE